MTAATLTLRQQFAAVFCQLPGFVAGAPARALLRFHSPVDVGEGVVVCMGHRKVSDWPCREWIDAAEVLAARPSWRRA